MKQPRHWIPESERYIQAALQKVMRNRTTLVIAHRLSTIENADVILVMDHGAHCRKGPLIKSLLKKNGAYLACIKYSLRSALKKMINTVKVFIVEGRYF